MYLFYNKLYNDISLDGGNIYFGAQTPLFERGSPQITEIPIAYQNEMLCQN